MVDIDTAGHRPRLAESVEQLWAEHQQVWDVVIVGSGYGGAVAAASFAGLRVNGRPLSVCVLERGNEYLPGDFPARFADLPRHARMSTDGGEHGPADGLFDVRVGKDVCALVANGLGGGSLINAGVLVEADPTEVETRFQGRGALIQALSDGGWYARAINLLGGRVQVQGWEQSNDLGRHPLHRFVRKGEALARLPVDGEPSTDSVPVAVAMGDEANAAGLTLKACTLCGDCMTGCNQGAKNSLDTNLLQIAHEKGARLFTGVSVLSLDPRYDNQDHWTLRVVCTDPKLQAQQNQQDGAWEIKAHHVVLAAGALGSSEILLRSRSDHLMLSGELGARFSCNGDNLAAFYAMASPVHGTADESVPVEQRFVGPTITREIRVAQNAYQPHIKDLRTGHAPFRVQEFGVPAPLKRLFEEIVTTSDALRSASEADTSRHGGETAGQPDPLAVDPCKVERTLLVGVIGHDSARGVLQLDKRWRSTREYPKPGHVRIHWPDARHGAELDASEAILRHWAQRSGHGHLLPNPLWKLLPGKLSELISQPRGPVLTVHPLGGCAVRAAEQDGVVDEYGRVFNGSAGEGAFHPGLVVLDGSVFGHSLGANPALSIAAFALRAAARLAMDWWETDAQPLGQQAAPVGVKEPVTAPPPEPPCTPYSPLPDTRVQVIERMRGKATIDLDGKPTDCMVELTLAFDPVGLRSMSSHWGRVMRLTDQTELPLGPEEATVKVQRLAVYPLDTWNRLRLEHAKDDVRETHVALDYHLQGSLSLFEREASGESARRWRAAGAWLLNRGIHEIGSFILQGLLKTWPGLGRLLPCSLRRTLDSSVNPASHVKVFDRAKELWRVASRAGERRLLSYRLTALDVKSSETVGDVIGTKTLTYDRRANPWRQLMRMHLQAMPGLVKQHSHHPELELDTSFLAGQGLPLMRVTRQTNQADALLDMVSFGLYMARLLIHIHLWTFRRSDLEAPRPIQRLPAAIRGMAPGEWVEPEITELTVDHVRKAHGRYAAGDPVKIRLTRYARRNSDKPALVLIHGYSVSGNTFTHASIPVSAAQHFWREGRDVWVLDLRTSTGLPTCTYPWSMELVALIDIPAALLHVRQVSGEPVDVLAHCIGCVMFSMAMLTRAEEVRGSRVDLGVDDWLTNTHFGTLNAFHGTKGLTAHPTVNCVVLSQKGPVLRYSDANIARAFIMQTQRRWLFNDVFSFQAPESGGAANELLDRLLASLPYPAADYDTQNPWCPTRRTPWTQSRRRMDMLYGRDFSAENLHPDTLDAIDDLFGPMHLDTVAQTIHFARYNVVTNQRGEGEFFTLARLQERWNVKSTLAIHGKDNGLVDVSTNQLLADRFAAVGLPFERKVFSHRGHQDVFIGRDSREVYECISQFLNGPPSLPPQPQVASTVWASPPWIGPRIRMPDGARGTVRVCATSRVDQGPARMVLLPVRLHNERVAAVGSQALFDALQNSQKAKKAGHWHRIAVSQGWLDWASSQQAGGMNACLALLVHAPLDTSYQPPDINAAVGARPNNGANSLPPPSFPLDVRVPLSRVSPGLAAMGLGLHPQLQAWAMGAKPHEVRQSLIWLCDLEAAHHLLSHQDAVTFALGSCQYPPGLMDAQPAQRSLKALAQALQGGVAGADSPQPDDPPRPSFALFCGDQIYADASAGLADPVRRDERFHVPYERALRLPAKRAVLQRVPSAMLLDDHEIVDNWSRLPKASDDFWKNQALRDNALHAFFHYQRMGQSKRKDADQALNWGGLPIYLLDTRSLRSARPLGQGAHIVSEAQRQRLSNWLIQHRHKAKCIVTPSLLLPRRQTHRSGIHSDAFDGYPHSQEWLIHLLLDHDVQHTLFLSGDEHHSFACEAEISDPALQRRIPLVCIHSSALYAPYPFANGRPSDLRVPDSWQTSARTQRTVDVRTVHEAPGDGFTRLRVDRHRHLVEVWFHRGKIPTKLILNF